MNQLCNKENCLCCHSLVQTCLKYLIVTVSHFVKICLLLILIIHPCVAEMPPLPAVVDDGGDGDEGAVGVEEGGQEERGQSQQWRQEQERGHEIELLRQYFYLLLVKITSLQLQ